MTLKSIAKFVLPSRLWNETRELKIALNKLVLKKFIFPDRSQVNHYTAKTFNEYGLNVSRIDDFYSPLPVITQLEKSKERWAKPSGLAGVNYDLGSMKDLLMSLVSEFGEEYAKLPSYAENAKVGFGPGYTPFDAMVLYMMIRRIRPKRYFEVGSGLSTYYCSLAASQNAKEGRRPTITCVEPYPYEKLASITEIHLIQKEVQELDISEFNCLEAGDVLFVDSSHAVRMDGDVPFLYLEVIPRLKKGVLLHIHDIPFPYNIPYPPEYWVLGRDWPIFWNEAMLLQAFLAYNDSYQIRLSTPLIRYFDENFLKSNIPGYQSVEQEPNTFSSIWIEKVK